MSPPSSAGSSSSVSPSPSSSRRPGRSSGSGRPRARSSDTTCARSSCGSRTSRSCCSSSCTRRETTRGWPSPPLPRPSYSPASCTGSCTGRSFRRRCRRTSGGSSSDGPGRRSAPLRSRSDRAVVPLAGLVDHIRPEELVEGLVDVRDPEGREDGAEVRVREHLEFLRELDRRGADPVGPVPRLHRGGRDAGVDVPDPSPLSGSGRLFVLRKPAREFRAHPPDRLDEFPLRPDADPDAGGGHTDLQTAPTRGRLLRETVTLPAVAAWADDHAEHPSHHEHEAREACAVVVHGDTELLDLVLDLPELHPAELRHLPHLPLQDLTQSLAGPVHVALRDVPAVAVVAEAERDPRTDHLALPAALLREDAVRDRAHRELLPLDLADVYREDGGHVHEVLLGEACVREGRIERVQVGNLRDRPARRDEESRGDRKHFE